MASSASSSYSGNSFNNFANGDEANPQVSWPSSMPDCPQLKQLMTETTTTMVMPMTMPTNEINGNFLGADESCDVAICASPLTLSASSDSYQAYYQGSSYQ